MKTLVLKICSLAFISLILLSCFLVKDDNDVLTFRQEQVQEPGLRLDGLYHATLNQDPTIPFPVYVLYKNGAVLHPASFYKLEEAKRALASTGYIDSLRCVAWAWGLFHLEEDSIFIERLHPGSGKYYAHIQKGVVTSDTTFVISSIVNSYSGERSSRSDVFRFVKLPAKPDSVTDVLKLHEECN